MNTKKALGALLGLLGSLPAFPFLPLAGFSAPLLFTASLQKPIEPPPTTTETARTTQKRKSKACYGGA